MTQRLSALIPIFILNISLLVACTSPEAEISAPEAPEPDVVSDTSQDSSDEEVSQENGGSNDATESSDSSPSETEGGSLEQGVCEDSFALQCGASFGSIQTKEPQMSSITPRAMILFAFRAKSFAITS